MSHDRESLLTDVIAGTAGLRPLSEGQEMAERPARGGKAVKRKLVDEIAEGFEALAQQRQGKRTLRTHALELKPAPEVRARDLVVLRQRLHLSRAVFAAYLRTNPRTLENWEQGRARPNAQAALLIRLVERYPDTVARLARI